MLSLLIAINGFSNRFYGWGGEEDDIFARFTKKKISFTRPSMGIGRYDIAWHKIPIVNRNAWTLVDETRKGLVKMEQDGLSTLKFNLIGITEERFFTHIKVNVTMTTAEQNFSSITRK